MNKITLSFNNSPQTEAVVLVDGNWISGKNVKGKTIYEYQTEKSQVELNIFSLHEFSGKFWWFFALIYYLISIFGLLNPKYEKSGKVFNYKGVVNLEENTFIKISYPIAKVGEMALNFFEKTELNNESNVYYVDETIKKRVKTFKFIKIIAFVLALLGVLAIFIL